MVEENLSRGMCMLSLPGPLSQSVGGRARHGCSMEVNLTPLFYLDPVIWKAGVGLLPRPHNDAIGAAADCYKSTRPPPLSYVNTSCRSLVILIPSSPFVSLTIVARTSMVMPLSVVPGAPTRMMVWRIIAVGESS